MSMDPKKSNKTREIVRLQQFLEKWRKQANSSKTNNTNTNNNTSSKSIKFLKRTLSLSEHEEGVSNNNVVPKGYLAVSVGENLKRFIIPNEYLTHQAFQILLREAEEEFGFQQIGVLRIPCEVSVFENILKIVERKKNKFSSTHECRIRVEEIMGFCYLENQHAYSSSHHSQSPLCR
ncbi:hypothetical protein TanjilG_15715 [Lupinus angustifolius]|uniref:Uncharacterized protein n=1 Tax=Lupinus angustifolius TaxID=3871 RepID=A0A1J7IHF2_LUPAN|nr:PREDICTED: auxin-responsive protein SAUR50 [Lupinus angustifolius]OIW14361.1 hypothetical protein TanjilG_15715 [Lupinus angustifolius]